MDLYRCRAVICSVARWLLLGAVIAGVLAMHVLSAPEGFDGHSMPGGMATAAATPTSGPVDADTAVDVPAMRMGLNTGPTVAIAVSGHTVESPHLSVLPAMPAGSMAMTCCTLSVAIGLGLLQLLATALRRRRPDISSMTGSVAHYFQRRRGPPVTASRLSLCVQRV